MATAGCVRLELVETEGLAEPVAVLLFDNPGSSANLLSASVLDEIEAHLDALGEQPISGLVFLSAKPGMFIAGADLTEFAAGLDRSKEEIVAVSRRGQELFARLAQAPFVTIAAIDGICVGGGAELAVWCDRRIVTDNPKTQLGFPEVKLGLFPGWGGTARTPRMIGLANAVELVTGGDHVSGEDAHKLGLADDVVRMRNAECGVRNEAPPNSADKNSEFFTACARMIAAEQASGQYLRDRERWSAPIALSETELTFLGATASAVIQQKTAGHYPAPMAALELMLEASQVDLDAACKLEAEGFAPLFGSPVNRALLNVFFLTDRAKKDEGETGKRKADSGRVTTASIVGAGTMGQGIAAANAKRGVHAVLSDSRAEALAAGVSGVVAEAPYDKQLNAPSAEKAIQMAALVDGSTDVEQIAASDVVIEAIIEDADAKRSLFKSLEPHLGEATILCSNTSTIPITQLAKGLAHPDRFAGLHFFNPVRKMPLVEIIRGAETSDETVATLRAYTRRLGKTPVVVGDGPGFLVNRLLMPYMAEAALMAAEGVPIKAIEKAAKRFGMPMGPLTLHDVVGLDVCLHAGKVMQKAFPDRVAPATLIERLVSAGRLGQKNGKGFFDYPPTKPGKPPKGIPSADVEALIEADSRQPTADSLDITDRLMLPMLVEATRAIEDGIVADARDVDLALILGIGFPPFRGGLFHWADTLGAAAIVEKLKPLESLGERFSATAMIADAASSGRSFY